MEKGLEVMQSICSFSLVVFINFFIIRFFILVILADDISCRYFVCLCVFSSCLRLALQLKATEAHNILE